MQGIATAGYVTPRDGHKERSRDWYVLLERNERLWRPHHWRDKEIALNADTDCILEY
jgi:hypothetical protein